MQRARASLTGWEAGNNVSETQLARNYPVIVDTRTDRTSALMDTVVTAIWAAVLGSLDLHVSSDFFDLGGDSMKMLTMLFQVTEQTGVEVTPAVLFENPTLDEFCRAVRALGLSN